MAAHSFHVLFCVVFQNFYAILQKFCTLTRVYLKYSGWTWTYYHWVILPRLCAIRPSRTHYEFMILFDFYAPSVKSFTGNDAILISGYLSG